MSRASLLAALLLSACVQPGDERRDNSAGEQATAVSRYVHTPGAPDRSKDIGLVRTKDLAISVKAVVREGLPLVSMFLSERPYGSDGFAETTIDHLRPWADSVRVLLSGAWTVRPGESEGAALPVVPSTAPGTFLLWTSAANKGAGDLHFLLMLANDPSVVYLSQLIDRRAMERLLTVVGAAADSADQMAAVNREVPYLPLVGEVVPPDPRG